MTHASISRRRLFARLSGAWASLALPIRAAVAQGPSTAPTTAAEVRTIDRDQGRITLRHGPIATLDMPGMTMVFQVAQPQMLEGLKEGDHVRFSADRVGGALTVTSMAPMPP
jgi:Cu/Ag efflux protein CusF